MSTDALRDEIRSFLRFDGAPTAASFETHSVVTESGYDRLLIQYRNEEGGRIPAFLLVPHGTGPFPSVLVHHQHAGQRHLGKSEVCGLAGDRLQAFGPALARRGIVVLAPDSICFEDRRPNLSGIEADEDADWLQHYNEMTCRLVRGDTLMRRVLQDSAIGVSLLCGHPKVDRFRIGTLGHSYGGNTVLFLSAVDPRIVFSCSSGAACSYGYKIANGIGIEMAEVLPGILDRFEIADLLKCVAPRRLCIFSATDDPYSHDADAVFDEAREAFVSFGVGENLSHRRYTGGHALTPERFSEIVEWVAAAATARNP